MLNNTQPLIILIRYLQVIVLMSLILYFGKTLFIPLFLGLLIAMILHPVSKWFEMQGWTKVFSITACLLIVAILFASLFMILIWQLRVFSQDAPVVFNRLETAIQHTDSWLKNAGVNINIQNDWKESVAPNLGKIVKSTLLITVNTVFILFITPVFTALFMYHRKVFIQYLKSITPAKYRLNVDIILQRTIDTYFNYIKGLILVYLLVAILNSIGFAALGVNNAILFGTLCAVMTIIPYIGIIISALLPISVVWLETQNIWYPIGVVAVLGFVQYLEANVIFPKAVGTQIHVSTMAMLIAVIAGGIIWGVAGMILFIPFVAILKIISDHIDDWKPINLLLSRK